MMRRRMVIALGDTPEPDLELPVRQPVPDDVDALAELMLDAYRGTIDADGSETMEVARDQVRGWLSGASGEPMLRHSCLALDGEVPVSAVLVSRFNGMPLIAYAMTAAGHKGRGLATALTQRVLGSLHAAGEREAQLWVTAGNPAERIYERLGFLDRAD